MVNATAAIGIPTALLAHQGGWDEILLVAGPILVVVGLLALARRRVTRAAAAAPHTTEHEDA
ncbi:MAG: hypothetical protein ABW219_10845 [Ilumatobacteraceae bacterium]